MAPDFARRLVGLDLNDLMARCGDDRELVCELLGLYEIAVMPTVDALRSSIERGHVDAALEAVHKLMGTLYTLSANQAAAEAARLQTMLRARDCRMVETLEHLDTCLDVVTLEVRAAVVVLSAELAEAGDRR